MILRVSNGGWVFNNLAHRDALERGMDPAGGPIITVFKLCFGTALPKLEWVVQGVISSFSGCLFVPCNAGQLS